MSVPKNNTKITNFIRPQCITQQNIANYGVERQMGKSKKRVLVKKQVIKAYVKYSQQHY